MHTYHVTNFQSTPPPREKSISAPSPLGPHTTLGSYESPHLLFVALFVLCERGCMYVHCRSTHTSTEDGRGITFPGARVTVSCELWVLGTEPQSSVSAPHALDSAALVPC